MKTAEEASEPVKTPASTVTVRKPVAKRINKTVSENIVGNKLLHSNTSASISHSSNNNHCSNSHHSSLSHSSSAHCIGDSPWKTYTNENNRLSNLNHSCKYI